MTRMLVTPPSEEELIAALRRMLKTGTMLSSLPGLNALVQPVVEGVKRLAASPDAPLWELHVDRVESDGSPDDGLIRVTQQRARLPTERMQVPPDDKWKFQYRPSLLAQLRKRGLGAPALRHQQLLRDSHTLYLVCREQATRRMRILDQILPGYRFAERHETALRHDLDVLRILLYDPKQRGGTLGKRHIDKAFMADHLADNDPGLLFRDEDDPYVALIDQILSFFGEKSETLTNGALKGVSHHIRSQRLALEDGAPRWVGIYFTHTY